MLIKKTLPPARTGATDPLAVLPPALGWGLAAVAGLLLAVAGEGPDFGHYTDWAAAALSGDIFTLRGNVLSPGGVPFTIAAAGPGLLFGVAKAVLAPLTLGTASLLTGWIAAVVSWSSALVVLRRVADGREWLALLGAAALFVGTHAGLYSHVYATEVFADALIAALWAMALTGMQPRPARGGLASGRTRWRTVECVAAGALAGLLLLVRAHVVLYAVPALWIAVFGDRGPAASAVASASVAGAVRRRDQARATGLDWSNVAVRLVAIGVPLAIAAGEYAVVNHWMTGSISHPPYLYGGPGFSSVDLRHPELAAVLVHSWHGLLSYHPLYAVAVVAVAILALRARHWQPLWIATLLAALAHVWVQAGWYIWWLGGSTFGMRGMAPAALPLVAGLIAVIRQDADDRPARAWLWVGATVLSCAWSYPLLLRGYTGFYAWPDLISAQRPALAALALVAALLLYTRVSPRSASARLGLAVRAGVLAGAAASLAYLAWQLSMIPALAARLMLGVAAGAAVLIASRAWLRNDARTMPSRAPLTLVLGAALAVFAVQAVLFVRLAVRTERFLASGAPPPRDFEYAGASPVDELRVTYAEYAEVPGFRARKAAFRRFLEWQRVTVTRMSPEDREIAADVRLLLDGDPAFDELLVEASARDGVVLVSGSGMSDAQESRVRQLAGTVPGVRSVTFATN